MTKGHNCPLTKTLYIPGYQELTPAYMKQEARSCRGGSTSPEQLVKAKSAKKSKEGAERSHVALRGPDVLVKQVTPKQSPGMKQQKIKNILRFLRGQPQILKGRFPTLGHHGECRKWGRFIIYPSWDKSPGQSWKCPFLIPSLNYWLRLQLHRFKAWHRLLGYAI